MPWRPPRPCLHPGCTTLTRTPRCPPHQRRHDQVRNARRHQYQGDWQATSRRARADEPWCHCTRPHPWHGTPCNTEADLTLDHETGTVECRRCNSAHRRNP